MGGPFDFLGREIRPGDIIVYPWHWRGSIVRLNKLSVQKVTPEYVSGYNSLGRPIKVINFKNIVVIVRADGGPA